MEYIYQYSSPIGEILLTGRENLLTGLWFVGQKHFDSFLSAENTEKYIPVFGQTIKWLDIYFSGSKPDFTPPLGLSGTPFRLAVWNILLSIPYGCTMTYGDIAKIMAEQSGISKMSAQAVGGAVGHNPVSIIVPCHRVIGADGNLVGYAGGIDKKLMLLELEKADISRGNTSSSCLKLC